MDRATKKRKCSDSAVQTITGNTSKRRVIEINVADPDSFTVQFCMRQDPNEEGTEVHSVLFGILQKNRIQEFFDVDEENDLPTHGFFVNDVFHLCYRRTCIQD